MNTLIAGRDTADTRNQQDPAQTMQKSLRLGQAVCSLMPIANSPRSAQPRPGSECWRSRSVHYLQPNLTGVHIACRDYSDEGTHAVSAQGCLRAGDAGDRPGLTGDWFCGSSRLPDISHFSLSSLFQRLRKCLLFQRNPRCRAWKEDGRESRRQRREVRLQARPANRAKLGTPHQRRARRHVHWH